MCVLYKHILLFVYKYYLIVCMMIVLLKYDYCIRVEPLAQLIVDVDECLHCYGY